MGRTYLILYISFEFEILYAFIAKNLQLQNIHNIFCRKIRWIMEGTDKIEAGLKLTPQRKAVYGLMTELRHAPNEEIISCAIEDGEITLSAVPYS